MRMIHIADGSCDKLLPPPVVEKLRELGELEIIEHAARMSEDEIAAHMRQADVVLGGWGSVSVPSSLARKPGRVRYFCCLSGSVRGFVSAEHIEAGIPVTNWGDMPAQEVAEGAMTLLLTTLKGIHANIVSVRNGGGADNPNQTGGTLRGLTVGIYGFGVIGRKFAEMLVPFDCEIRVFDPFAEDFPEYVNSVSSLDELFRACEAVAVHAGLTDQTRKSVTAELLSLLPDQGIIVNTARGDIIDQEALFAELETGRLRAGLDVLAAPESLPSDHPARTWTNLVWTCHNITRGWPGGCSTGEQLHPMYKICLENLRRFRDGQPLRFIMDRKQFELST
ncbi:MAG: NAD(P)-dependent oxidoreductase [Verrucomicrobiota bacterium]